MEETFQFKLIAKWNFTPNPVEQEQLIAKVEQLIYQEFGLVPMELSTKKGSFFVEAVLWISLAALGGIIGHEAVKKWEEFKKSDKPYLKQHNKLLPQPKAFSHPLGLISQKLSEYTEENFGSRQVDLTLTYGRKAFSGEVRYQGIRMRNDNDGNLRVDISESHDEESLRKLLDIYI